MKKISVYSLSIFFGGVSLFTACSGSGSSGNQNNNNKKGETKNLSIYPDNLPKGEVGKNYYIKFEVKGGTKPYLFELFSGSLPEGITLDKDFGEIKGIPKKPGKFDFTIKVKDSSIQPLEAEKKWTLEITSKQTSGDLKISPSSIPNPRKNWPFYFKFEADGGKPPYTFSLSYGIIPKGLNLDPSGKLKGIPENEGKYYLTLYVEDSSNPKKWGKNCYEITVLSEWSSSDPKKKYNLFFIHHSVGQNLWVRGPLEKVLINHGYNPRDMTYFEGNVNGYIIGNHTDIKDWPTIFNTPEYFRVMYTWELPQGQFHHIMMFKACFPNSNIESEEMLEDYKKWCLSMIPTFKAHPEVLFVPFSTPPLNPVSTNKENAARARRFANWLKYEFSSILPNLISFDFFDILANSPDHPTEPNMLKKEYRSGSDSHPTENADKEVTKKFIPFINSALKAAGFEQ